MTTIRFAGDPLDEIPPFAEIIITGVGIAMLNWARLEQQVDALLVSVNKQKYSLAPIETTPFASFKKKVALFRRWFVHDPRFAQQRDRAEKLVTALSNACEDRNLLAHSNVQEFIEGPPIRMVVFKTIIKGDEFRIIRGEWTSEQIIGLAKDFRKLSHALWTISAEVFQTEFLESLQIS